MYCILKQFVKISTKHCSDNGTSDMGGSTVYLLRCLWRHLTTISGKFVHARFLRYGNFSKLRGWILLKRLARSRSGTTYIGISIWAKWNWLWKSLALTMLLFFRKMAKLVLTLAKMASMWLRDGTLRSRRILRPIYELHLHRIEEKKKKNVTEKHEKRTKCQYKGKTAKVYE